MTCDQDPPCDEDGYGELCIEGTVYGYCGADDCYGICDDLGRCPCSCHRQEQV